MTRVRQSPGIELHEIDKSQYGKIDYSIVGTTTLMCGVASKGIDYVPQWINTKQTLIDTFGYPETEFERYFYNGCVEILEKGGILLGAKLPYDNDSLGCYTYADFSLSGCYFDKSQTEKYSIRNNEAIRSLFDNVDAILSSHDLSTTYATVNSEPIGAEGSFPKMTTKELDDYKTGVRKLKAGTFRVVDLTRCAYGVSQFYYGDSKNVEVECVGIVPVIVTPIAAMYFQGILNTKCLSGESLSVLQPITDIKRRNDITSLQEALGYDDQKDKYLEQYCQKFWSDESIDDYTLSKTLAEGYFPNVNFKTSTLLERKHLNSIGVVVLKAYKEIENDNRIKLSPVESFIGSLDKSAKTEKNGSYFIDDIVNSQSEYINFFSNIVIRNEFPDLIVQGASVPTSLGFTKAETKKKMSYENSIAAALQVVFDKVKDPNIADIDIVADAGVTTIAQRVKDLENKTDDEWDQLIRDDSWFDGWKMPSHSPSAWQAAATMLDSFCSNVRKDCICLIDAPRYFCLEGDNKIVRPTSFDSTIEDSIVPKLKLLYGLNSSYSAGYCNWFQALDDYSGDMTWLPPSIKAAGVCTYVDTYSHPWDAPAGLTRGTVSNVIDIAFSPYNDEAGKIYAASWNYAVSYPLEGIVLEGQKTFQKAQTALDRVNVRRLVNYLKKRVTKLAKYFLYEQNTAWLRQRFVDTLRPIFEDVVNGYGLSAYIIKCDDVNNTAETIDRNELHCTIGIRPVKAVEYIVLNFVLVNQSTSVSEMTANV